MAVTVGTPTAVINNFNKFEVIAPLTLSASYPGTAAGDPLSLAGLCASNSVPDLVEIFEQPPTGTVASGLQWKYAVGTTQANGALQALTGAGANVGNVTYASVNAANLKIRAVFPKFV